MTPNANAPPSLLAMQRGHFGGLENAKLTACLATLIAGLDPAALLSVKETVAGLCAWGRPKAEAEFTSVPSGWCDLGRDVK